MARAHTKPTANVVERPNGSLVIRCPFSQEWVNLIKYRVPSLYRSWEPEERTWSIDSLYAKTALETLAMYFDVHLVSASRDDQRRNHSGFRNPFGDDDPDDYGDSGGSGGGARTPPFKTSKEAVDLLAEMYPHHTALGLLPSVTWEVVQAAYRALAKLYHPDKPDGSVERMQSLNNAYDALKERYGKT